MWRYRAKSRCRIWARRCCATLAAFGYLVTVIGVPLPASQPAKDLRHPFPCQDHACGCQSAEECWQNCCCFSPEERFAWARAHGVQPPAYAQRPANEGWRTVRLREKVDETRCPHCAHCETSVAKSEQSKNPSRTRWVPGFAARHCKGLPSLWINAGAVLPLTPPQEWTPFEPFHDSIASLNTPLISARTNPPDPPPRLPQVLCHR